MIVIFAEKPDMGTQIAAALDKIHLKSGDVEFKDIGKHISAIKAQRNQDGCFHIRYNGQDTIVTWGYGHMCELKQAADINPDWKDWNKLPLPFIPNSYELKLIDSAKGQYKLLRQWFNDADEIICATDNDREGDLIFDYLYTYMRCRTPYKRAIFNKQSKEEFIKAFNPCNIVSSKDRQLVILAGRARSAGDFIVGVGPTVAMTLKYGNAREVLSVGRVQTATLNMIILRERAIRNFKPEDYFIIEGQFTTAAGEKYKGIHCKKHFKVKKDAQDEISRITSQTGIVNSVNHENVVKKKPYLYSLPTLQMDANKTYGFSLSRTHELAQSLYDGGYTTYPRTDSNFLPDDAGVEIQASLDMLYRIYGVSPEIPFNDKNKHYFNSEKVASHYAIVTTKKEPENLKPDEKKIYDMIAKSVLCITAKEATIAKVTVTTSVDGEMFETNGNTVVDPGFYALVGYPKENCVPNVKEKDSVSAKVEIVAKQTEPPKRYTDASLLAAMINCGKNLEDEVLRAFMASGPGEMPKGLGRPSSQASIVKTLESRGYIRKEKKTIFPTEKGFSLIDLLPVEDLKSAEMTAKWELRLDHIESGKENYDNFMRDLESSVIEWTNKIMEKEGFVMENKECSYVCPVCGKNVVSFHWGYACEDKDECGFSVGTKIGETIIPESEIEKLINGQETCKMIFKNKDGKEFKASMKVDKEAKKAVFVFSDEFSSFKCPICRRTLKDIGAGYACTDKESCGFILWKKVAGKILSETQIKKLLETGETDFLRGFKSKTGNNFDAKLKLNKSTKKVEFVFEEMKDDNSAFHCPVCKRTLKRLSWGYVCDKEAGCEFSLGKRICQKSLSDSQIKKLLKAEEVEVKGMTSKNGKKFDAVLKINEDGKLEFIM